MSAALLKTAKAGIHVTERGPYIVCHSGKKFFPNDVRTRDIDIMDVAHALSNMCRFGGHTSSFYSVAQHCVLVSSILPDDLKLRGLLHDGSEAYLVDVPRPIKKLVDFTAYRTIESTTQAAIYSKFGLDPHNDPEAIHEADNLLLATEARDLMDNPFWAHDMPKAQFKITAWTPDYAKKTYLRYFNAYRKF